MRGWWIRAGLALLILVPACSEDKPAGPAPCRPTDDPVLDLELVDLDDKTFDIRDETCENMVLLNFGATWCNPCTRGLPSMEELHQEYGDKGLTVVAVNVQEEAEVVRQYFDELDVTFPVLLDPLGHDARAWDIRVIPTYVLVSLEGEEIQRIEGFDPGRIDQLKAEIATDLAP